MLMSLRLAAILPLACMVILMAAAQLLFKMAGLHANSHAGWVAIFALNYWLWAGLGASGLGLICWLLTLRNFSLSIAYPWTALIYVITPLASSFYFGEILSTHYMLGMSLVVVGVFFTASNAQTR